MVRDLPSTALPAPPLVGRARRRALADMTLTDHGGLRLIYSNRHRVDAQVWRSAQPGRRALQWAKDNGIRTILNLRGERPNCGAYQVERDAAQEFGLRLVNFPIRSRGMPEKQTLHAAAHVFDWLDYPLLMHCKSGADRAGFMAALYLHLHVGRPLEEASRQLALKYGHVRYAKTGMLDYFLARYAADTGGDASRFLEWVDTVYDPDALAKEFHANSFASFLVDKVLRRE